MLNLGELAQAFASNPLAVICAAQLAACAALFGLLLRAYGAQVRMAIMHAEASVKMHALFERVLDVLEDLPALRAAKRKRLTAPGDET